MNFKEKVRSWCETRKILDGHKKQRRQIQSLDWVEKINTDPNGDYTDQPVIKESDGSAGGRIITSNEVVYRSGTAVEMKGDEIRNRLITIVTWVHIFLYASVTQALPYNKERRQVIPFGDSLVSYALPGATSFSPHMTLFTLFSQVSLEIRMAGYNRTLAIKKAEESGNPKAIQSAKSRDYLDYNDLAALVIGSLVAILVNLSGNVLFRRRAEKAAEEVISGLSSTPGSERLFEQMIVEIVREIDLYTRFKNEKERVVVLRFLKAEIERRSKSN